MRNNYSNPYWRDKTLAPHVPYEMNYYEIGRESYDVERLIKDVDSIVESVEWTKKDRYGDWESVT